MIFDRALRRRGGGPQNAVTSAAVIGTGVPASGFREAGARAAMKLSTVSRCVEALSDSMGKLPVYPIQVADVTTGTTTRTQTTYNPLPVHGCDCGC